MSQPATATEPTPPTDEAPSEWVTPDKAASEGELPDYKGAPLDPEAGPGLGCFWFQVGLLVALLVVTPLSVVLAAPPWLSAALLILTLALLFFVGQTMIFLLRLVAADRRTHRRPLRTDARRTVGQLEEERAAEPAAEPAAEQAPETQEDEDR